MSKKSMIDSSNSRGKPGHNSHNLASHNLKSQVTMFVLLGLIMLIIIALLLNLKNTLAPKRWGIEEILHELEVGRIKNHITDCMSDIGIEAVNYLGTNGGYIYDFQGGTIPFNNSLLGSAYLNYTYLNKHYFVSYGLKKNMHCDQINYSTAGYPYPELPFSGLQAIYDGSEVCRFSNPSSDYDGFFGESNMTKLCYAIRETSCKPFATGLQSGLTIQAQLEDYIAKKLPLCTNFSAFAERMGVIDIVPESAPIVEADIQFARTVLIVKYPVKIVFQNQDPISKILNYQAVLNIRLGGLYHFAYNALSSDSQIPGWDITREYISLFNYWLPGFGVTKRENPCPDCPEPYNQDDLIEFTDTKSLINGRAMVFRVAVENRRPAIDFIPSTTINAFSTSEFNIPFSAYDPDDDLLKYYFLSFGSGDVACSGIGDFIPPSDIIAGQAGSNLGGAGGWCEADSRVGQSLPYSVLWAPIGQLDVGRHEVALLVIDDSGMFDYQSFWLNVTYSPNVALGNCYAECVGAGHGDEVCTGICTIAANECSSNCIGGEFYGGWAFMGGGAGGPGVPGGPNADDCRLCLESVQLSSPRYVHLDCSSISDNLTCIGNMPDCFWVKENQSNSFVESCYNDYNLAAVNQPAYILEN